MSLQSYISEIGGPCGTVTVVLLDKFATIIHESLVPHQKRPRDVVRCQDQFDVILGGRRAVACGNNSEEGT
jgi:hypothetical protein